MQEKQEWDHVIINTQPDHLYICDPTNVSILYYFMYIPLNKETKNFVTYKSIN
jgi:hypothetical protein